MLDLDLNLQPWCVSSLGTQSAVFWCVGDAPTSAATWPGHFRKSRQSSFSECQILWLLKKVVRVGQELGGIRKCRMSCKNNLEQGASRGQKADWSGALYSPTTQFFLSFSTSYCSGWWGNRTAFCTPAPPPVSVFTVHRKRLRGGCTKPKLLALCLFFGMTIRICVVALRLRNVFKVLWSEFGPRTGFASSKQLEHKAPATSDIACFHSSGLSCRTCSASFPISVLWISALEKHKSIP